MIYFIFFLKVSQIFPIFADKDPNNTVFIPEEYLQEVYWAAKRRSEATVATREKKRTVFFDYLGMKEQESCTTLLNQGYMLSDVYKRLKLDCRNAFMQSLKLFRRDHPEKSIYDD